MSTIILEKYSKNPGLEITIKKPRAVKVDKSVKPLKLVTHKIPSSLKTKVLNILKTAVKEKSEISVANLTPLLEAVNFYPIVFIIGDTTKKLEYHIPDSVGTFIKTKIGKYTFFIAGKQKKWLLF